MEIILPIIFMICIIVGISRCTESHTAPKSIVVKPTQYRKTKPRPKPKPIKKVKAQPSKEWVEAKSTLMELGFTAAEAKEMLNNVSASTAEQYVTQAMKRVKI